MTEKVHFSDVAAALAQFAPYRLQEDYDNVGLLVGEPETEATGVMVCVDITEPVLEEAVAQQCNLVVSHHPIIFRGLKRLCGNDPAQRIVIKALRNGLGIIAAHTNLDSAPHGVSYALAHRLGIQVEKPLVPKGIDSVKLVVYIPSGHVDSVGEALFKAGAGQIGAYSSCSFRTLGEGTFFSPESSNPYVGKVGEISKVGEVKLETIVRRSHLSHVVEALYLSHPYEEPAYDIFSLENPDRMAGLGCIGELAEEMSSAEFLAHVADKLEVPSIRHSAPLDRKIQRVAVCGGSGSEFISTALSQRADAYVTADIKYHDFQRPDGRMLLLDVGHYESERVARELLVSIIRKRFINFAVRVSCKEESPVRYHLHP